MEHRFVYADEGVDIMLNGGELGGRGMKYCPYNFHMDPRYPDTVFYWRLRNDEWEDGEMDLDYFMEEMDRGYPPLFVKKEAAAAAAESPGRVLEGREGTKILINDRILTDNYLKKIDLLGDQDGCFHYMDFNHWSALSLNRRNAMLSTLVGFDYPFTETLLDSVMSQKLRWGGRWVEGLNKEFGTTLTREDYLKAIGVFSVPRGMTKEERGRRELRYIEELTPTRTQKTGKYVKNAMYTTNFEGLYKLITAPVNEEIFRGKYKVKALSGRRGRPWGNTYIEFNMKQLPVTMLRSKDGNQTYSEDEAPVYCICGTERLKPTATQKDKIEYYTQIKKFMHRYSEIPYPKMTPCSLDYWMENIERRFKTDRNEMTDSARMFGLFQRTSVLQIRDDGQYRFYREGQGEEGWSPDPCYDTELINCIDDDEIYGAVQP